MTYIQPTGVMSHSHLSIDYFYNKTCESTLPSSGKIESQLLRLLNENVFSCSGLVNITHLLFFRYPYLYLGPSSSFSG